jgi:hypothetical protein
MLRAAEEVQLHIERGHDGDAGKCFSEYSPIEFGMGSGIDVAQDEQAVRAAFSEQAEDLFQHSGACQEFFRGALARDSLLALAGISGVGKSWWLIDLAWRAMLQQRRVAFFEIGDLSQGQIMKRFAIRAARRPIEARTVRWPVGASYIEKGKRVTPETRSKRFSKELNADMAVEALRAVGADLDGSHLRLSVHPNRTVDVLGLLSIVKGWERQGWVPDLVVVDYADLLNPITKGDPWNQIDETWKVLRGLSQSLHCLLITATQANREAYTVSTIRPEQVSGARQKLDHSTSFFGISQTATEKKNNVMRLTWWKRREHYFDPTIACHCCGCLDLGNPAVVSVF